MGGGFSRIVTVCSVDLVMWCGRFWENGTMFGFHMLFCAKFEFGCLMIELYLRGIFSSEGFLSTFL